MSSIKKYSLIIIALVMLMFDIVVNQDIGISMLAVLIALSLIKRNIVLYVALIYVFLQLATSILAGSNSILSIFNGLIFSYLIYINWSNMEGKTFNRFRDSNVRTMIIFSAILQCLVLLPMILTVNLGILNIAQIALNWMQAMSIFIGFFFFCIRSSKVFDWYLISSVISLIGCMFTSIVFNQLNITSYVLPILFIIFNTIIVVKK